MSRRRAIEERLRLYDELREIMGAMKNIALIETHKLARVLEAQRILRETVERAAADFFAFHPALRMQETPPPELIVAIGSERGFCGDFNAAVAGRLEKETAGTRLPCLVLVGSRLEQHAEHLPGIVLRVEGPAMREEVRPAIARLMDALVAHPETKRAFSLQTLGIVHHVPRGDRSEVRLYRPIERFRSQRPAGAVAPPRLLLPPEEFVAGLIDQYLHATLHDVFYSSLAAENHSRLAHMQGAVNRLDERIEQSRLRMNQLRQEEITEEIEEIMLSAEALLRHSPSRA